MKKIKLIVCLVSALSLNVYAADLADNEGNLLKGVTGSNFEQYLKDASERYKGVTEETKKILINPFVEHKKGMSDKNETIRNLYSESISDDFSQEDFTLSVGEEAVSAKASRDQLFSSHKSLLKEKITGNAFERMKNGVDILTKGRNESHGIISDRFQEHHIKRSALHSRLTDFNKGVSDLSVQAVSAINKANSYQGGCGVACNIDVYVPPPVLYLDPPEVPEEKVFLPYLDEACGQRDRYGRHYERYSSGKWEYVILEECR